MKCLEARSQTSVTGCILTACVRACVNDISTGIKGSKRARGCGSSHCTQYVYLRGPVPKCSYYWRCPAAVNWQDKCTFEGWVGKFPSAVPPELRGTGGNMQACGGILPLPSWQYPSSAASVQTFSVGALPS